MVLALKWALECELEAEPTTSDSQTPTVMRMGQQRAGMLNGREETQARKEAPYRVQSCCCAFRRGGGHAAAKETPMGAYR